jgi:hypothetical protein
VVCVAGFRVVDTDVHDTCNDVDTDDIDDGDEVVDALCSVGAFVVVYKCV